MELGVGALEDVQKFNCSRLQGSSRDTPPRSQLPQTNRGGDAAAAGVCSAAQRDEIKKIAVPFVRVIDGK
jgi:hypothetical protein